MMVDRWNQWLTVDNNGNVHVGFYDTRNSVNRTGVDYYHAWSADGGVTWSDTSRISTQTSANLSGGQEFGDYNGLSVFGSQLIGTWTDNRDGPPNMKNVMASDAVNPAQGCLNSTLTVDAGDDLAICGVNVTLSATPAGSSGPYTYVWSPAELLNDPNSATPIATVTDDTVFTVEITDGVGCEASDTVMVSVMMQYAQSQLPLWTQMQADLTGDGLWNVTDYVQGLINQTNCAP